jgi:hypothetical protein
LNRLSLFALAAGLLAFTGGTSFQARSFELATPVARDNLAVYFVHGKGASAAAPLTLEQALGTGAVRLNEGPYHPITIENLSDQSIFIPLGTLLVGGLQDQVVAQDTILPPRSGRMPLEVFCVDPFRSVPRGSEDPTVFSSTGVLFPSRMARIALLAGGGDNKAVESLRQSGLWWSIETARAQLTRVLGEPLEPPQLANWKNDELREARSATILKARPSSSRTSLPLALENRKLAELLRPYLDLGAAAAAEDDVIGAVFAVNGRIEGAEIYQSHELFGRLWPSLLRAYATQALAASDADAEILPPVPVVEASLAAAQAAPQRTPDSIARDTDDMIFTEARATDGTWIHRSYVPKLAQAVDTPEAVIAGILQTGEVNGQPITALGDLDVMLAQDATSGLWSATISTSLLEQSLTRWMRQQSEWRDRSQQESTALAPIAAWAIGILFVLVPLLRALGRGVFLLVRAFASLTAEVIRLVVAIIPTWSTAAVRALARSLEMPRPSLRPVLVRAAR